MDSLTRAHRAGPDAPERHEAETAFGGSLGFKVTEQGSKGHCAGDRSAVRLPKRQAPLQAALALQGFEHHPLTGDLIAARWGTHKALPELAAAESFVAQLGGQQHELEGARGSHAAQGRVLRSAVCGVALAGLAMDRGQP